MVAALCEYWRSAASACGKAAAASHDGAAAIFKHSEEEYKMQKKKKLIIAAIAVVVVVIAMVVIFIATRPGTAAGSKTFTVEVVHSDGSKKTFTYHTDAEYLGEVLLAEGLIAGDVNQFGLYINTVDGEDAIWDEDSSYWALYMGEEYASQGIDQTPIADGDTFSLVYTIG